MLKIILKILLNIIETVCILVIFFASIIVHKYASSGEGTFAKEEVLFFLGLIFIIFLILRLLAIKLSVKMQSAVVILYLFLLYYVRFSPIFTNHILYHLTFFGFLSLIIITLINLYRHP